MVFGKLMHLRRVVSLSPERRKPPVMNEASSPQGFFLKNHAVKKIKEERKNDQRAPP